MNFFIDQCNVLGEELAAENDVDLNKAARDIGTLRRTLNEIIKDLNAHDRAKCQKVEQLLYKKVLTPSALVI